MICWLSITFQSLGRDSVCSDAVTEHLDLEVQVRFNPSVGILCVQTILVALRQRAGEAVSIPRSGFCVFRLVGMHSATLVNHRFNPSVGILCVQTCSGIPYQMDL